jgi:hypothetical protein
MCHCLFHPTFSYSCPLYSIRPGDPLAMLLFILLIEHLLHLLQRDLAGLHVGRAKGGSLGYVDDVAAVGSNTDDLPASSRGR